MGEIEEEWERRDERDGVTNAKERTSERNRRRGGRKDGNEEKKGHLEFVRSLPSVTIHTHKRNRNRKYRA